MESINVEPEEPLLHNQTETSSLLKQEAAPQSPFHTGSEMESINVEPQEPLLHKQTETSSLLKQEAAPQSPFHTGSERPYRGSTFTFLFLTAILTTFTFGIIASSRTDTLNMDTKLRLSNYNTTTHKCEIKQQKTPKASDSDPNSDSAFVTLVALASLSALALTIPFSLLLVSLLHRYTLLLVVLFSSFISGLVLRLSLLGGVLWFNICLLEPELCGAVMPRSSQIFETVWLISISVLIGHGLGKSWTATSVQNEVEVLKMVTGFWKEHFVLLVVNPVLWMLWMVLVNGPIFTFMWYAFNVGEIVPDFDVVNDSSKGCGLATGIPCCREARPGWVYAYIIFASFTAFWVLMVSTVLQKLVVGGTVSLWYFSPKGSSAIDNIKSSVRNAYGRSFGTACMLGTIVTPHVIVLMRHVKEKLSDKVLESNGKGRMLSIFRGCFSWMSQFSKHHPQLASIFLNLWESTNNLLPQTSTIITTFTTITSSYYLAIHAFVEMTLMGMIIICTLLQTLVVYGLLEYFSNTFASMTTFLIAGAFCFPIILIGLRIVFFKATSSVITTASYLYELERKVGREISKPEVGQAFMITAVPSLPETDGAQVAEPQSVASISEPKQTELKVVLQSKATTEMDLGCVDESKTSGA